MSIDQLLARAWELVPHLTDAERSEFRRLGNEKSTDSVRFEAVRWINTEGSASARELHQIITTVLATADSIESVKQ